MQDLFPNRMLRRITLLCLVLVCLSGIAKVLHNHAQDLVRGEADKTRCTICVAGQSPQQLAVKISVQLPEARESALQARSSRPVAAIADEASRIRPPPLSR